MLISDSHQFIFVQMRKVASSSMQEVLKPLAIPRPNGKLAHLLSRAGLQRDYRKYFFRTHDDMLAARKRMKAGLRIRVHPGQAGAWTPHARSSFGQFH